MDEEERTRHLRRLRKRVAVSKFPAPPPLDFSRRCNGACPSRPRRKAVPIVPGDPGRGRMHVFPRLPPWRIAGCLEGAGSSRPHGRNGMLWTRPTSGRRCAAPATLQWIAQRRVARVTPHAEPRRGARRETERELLAITFKILPHTPPASTWVCPRHIAGDTRPLCAAQGWPIEHITAGA